MSWMLAVVFSITMLMTAAFLQLTTVSFQGQFQAPALHAIALKTPKEVGYFAALNWSLYSVGVLPILAWAALSIWRDIPEVLRRLTDSKMVRDETFALVDCDRLERRWNRRVRSIRLLLVVVALLGTIFVMGDWWQTVAWPLLDPRALVGHKLNAPDSEYDWSISSLYAGSHTSTALLLVFTFIAYAGIPLVSTLLTLETVVVVFSFVTLLAPFSRQERGWSIVAMPHDEVERRCGWEAFSDFYFHLLVFALIVLAGLWLMIVQNAYLRNDGSADILQFIFTPTHGPMRITLDVHDVPDMPAAFAQWLLQSTEFHDFGKKGQIGAYLVGLLSYGSVALSMLLLGSAARESRKLARKQLRSVSRRFTRANASPASAST